MNLLKSRTVEPIPDFPSLLAADDQSCFLELGEVTADGCEFDVDGFDELADTMLFFCQLLDDPDANRMTQRLEHQGGLVLAYLVKFHRDLLIPFLLPA